MPDVRPEAQAAPEQLPGLSVEEAARRLARDGPNELPAERPRGLGRIVLGVFREPMIALLLLAFAVYLVLGDIGEGLILLVFVLVVVLITVVQERRTERALHALRDLSSPRALVVRGGERCRIPGRDVVCGDIVLLAEGDRVPADAVLLDGRNLRVDEALLTGESVAVRKSATESGAIPETMGPPGGEGTPFVYSGTLVVGGQGVARVAAIGSETELGRIGGALEAIEPGTSRLQREVRSLVRAFAIFGIALSVVVAFVYGSSRHDWLAGVLAGVALAMAILPEEFPVVLTVFMALGARRLSGRKVLTRRMNAVETLGATTVLAVDKTGTLTENRMVVRELWSPPALGAAGRAVSDTLVVTDGSLPENVHRLVEYAVLASPPDPFDPADVAFRTLAERSLGETEHVHRDWSLVREYPLSDELLALTHTWRSPEGGDYVIAAKGAPEAIADLCHLDEQARAEVLREVGEMADRGLRVLGVAHASFTLSEPLPPGQHDFDFAFVGLVGLADPVRADVPAAVAECRRAGVKVAMITGDYLGTARAVAREAGLSGGAVLTGRDLEELSDEALAERIGDVTVFARVVPTQKLRIVRAYQARGDVVAMTGDGVNDAPALKAADIGVAMGAHGTDVAREASDIVLVNDDFASLVAGIAGGRRVFDNLRKAMAYILAVHIPIAGMSLLPALLRVPLLMLPAYVAFLELIIDPASSVVFEAEEPEPGLMARPPRPPDERIFNARSVGLAALQGTIALVVVAAVYFTALATHVSLGEARALGLVALVGTNLGLVVAGLAWSDRLFTTLRQGTVALRLVLVGTPVLLAAVLLVPPLRAAFGLAAVDLGRLVGVLFAVALALAAFQLAERVHPRPPGARS